MKRRVRGVAPSKAIVSSSVLLCALCGSLASYQTKPAGPLSPREELATFQVTPGFKVELVAAEPEVIDPVAMTFDEDGRLFVVEMRGYPNAGVGEGQPNLPGRVRLLEDINGDGYFEKATVYVDNLRFPTSVCCWKGGIFVGNAPDLLYCKDTDGDGKADVRKVVYSGFGQKNIQQLLNGLQFHFDNWIHGCNGSNDSVLKLGSDSSQAPRWPSGGLALRGRHFRFNPDVPGSLEPTSGGGQYGLAADDTGQWFTCTNSQHARHIVLPDHYLRRSPHLAVSAVVNDLPDGVAEHGPAAKVFRTSPYEAWRVERTSRRVKEPMGRSFVSTELVPGGYITSGTGLLVYRGGAFPQPYHGNLFVCDPANNLIHRDVLLPVGPTFFARRPEEHRDCEFLTSTDNWFRPVFLCPGPDAAIYVADFYREIIETPLSLPEDIQKQYNLNSRERGRIWRIKHNEATALARPQLGNASAEELVQELGSADAWRRLTAQRLLIERQAKNVADALVRRAHTGLTPVARLHALWTLDGLGVLEPKHLQPSLRDRAWQVREQALRLAEKHFAQEPALAKAALALANDPVPRVRFQLALSLGEMPPSPESREVLRLLLTRDGVNPWVETALLSSVRGQAGTLLADLLLSERASPTLLRRLATFASAEGDQAVLGKVLADLMPSDSPPTKQQLSQLDAVLQGLARQGKPLAEWLKEQPDGQARIDTLFKKLLEIAGGDKEPSEAPLLSVRLLGHGPLDLVGPAFRKLLAPQTSSELQLAAVRALAGMRESGVADVLLAGWSSYGPVVRREIQEALFARPDRLNALLAALERGAVQPAHLELPRRDLLLKHPTKAIRERAQKLFAGMAPTERRKVVEEHRRMLDMNGDHDKGRLVFKKHCATCHRLEGDGHEVGADLLAGLKNKSPEALLIDILDPSREVDPRFLNYVVQSKSGRIYTGVITAETAGSIVLRRADKVEDTLLRADIDEIQSTAKSLMPEGLEKQITDPELADLLAYLAWVAAKK